MEEALYLENVTKKYHDYTLDHVSFSLPSGCIMGLIGGKRRGQEHDDQGDHGRGASGRGYDTGAGVRCKVARFSAEKAGDRRGNGRGVLSG